MFFASGYFYLITIGLQVICVLHSVRRGTQQKWIWIIIFLPVIGSLVYIFTEMFSGRDLQQVQSGVGAVFNPGGRVRKLEENLRFSDTFNNRIQLADAYLEAGQFQAAIDLYERSMAGNFAENEYLLSQLIIAYHRTGRHADIPPLAKKISKTPQFPRSKAHICYILALEKTGHPDEAEAEFKTLKARYSNFEARYEYALFLKRTNRASESNQLLSELLGEAPHLSGPEKRMNREWFSKAKDALRQSNA